MQEVAFPTQAQQKTENSSLAQRSSFCVEILSSLATLALAQAFLLGRRLQWALQLLAQQMHVFASFAMVLWVWMLLLSVWSGVLGSSVALAQV